MSDLDDEELEATRRLNGVAREKDKERTDINVGNIKKDIKRCEQLIKPEHANWIGISNQLAIAHLIERIKELEAKQEIKQIVDKIPIEEIEERIKIDEQEQAIQELERFNREGRIFATSVHEAIETVLNMLKENSAEIKTLTQTNKSYKGMIRKKDRQINYMANFINDNIPYTKDTKELENEEGIRTANFTTKYFERKSEE